jgi:lipopolysaccharide export system protein LptA
MMRQPRFALIRIAVFCCAGALVPSLPVAAQTLNNSFGGLSESSNDPIDIESDLLVVQDKQKLATFRGNVKAVQGTTTLRAQELLVHYVGGDKFAPAGSAESQPAPAVAQPKSGTEDKDKKNAQITLIEAKGEVIITSEDDQTTTSDWALYDLPAQLVTVGGNVVLTQGKNVLKGDRLVIDLKTGESRFEHTGNAAAGGSRIRALFMPKGKDGKDGEEAGGADAAKPREAEPDATAEDASSSPNGNDNGGMPDRSEAPLPLDPMRP